MPSPAGGFLASVADQIGRDGLPLAREWRERAWTSGGWYEDPASSARAIAAVSRLVRTGGEWLLLPVAPLALPADLREELREAGRDRRRSGGNVATLARDGAILGTLLGEAVPAWIAGANRRPVGTASSRLAVTMGRMPLLFVEAAVQGWEEEDRTSREREAVRVEWLREEVATAIRTPLQTAERASRLLEGTLVLRPPADALRIARRVRRHLLRALAFAQPESSGAPADRGAEGEGGARLEGGGGGNAAGQGAIGPATQPEPLRRRGQRHEPGGRVVVYGKDDDGMTLRVFLRRGPAQTD